ncbi:MAG: hypothetical protein M1818_000921 [Claussenomyces sp. TS43310]|nr:MAG: hypothetical protein M1818_000921 [Claussenomyces sp. TS43310]
MDKNYLDRINLRKKIMAEVPNVVLAANAVVKPAVDEFYGWLLSAYLPTRFPRNFQIATLPNSEKKGLLNHATGEELNLEPPMEPEEALRILGGVVEDDLLFLLPSPDGDGYRLEGFVTCFPSGFNPREKLGLKLRDIHTPVPGYKERLEKSMDRYFDRLEVGNFVKRANVSFTSNCVTIADSLKWTITTTNKLFIASGSHLYEGEKADPADVDIDITNLRCERQVLHRLPDTKALLFSFKTYLYPIASVKAEGSGPDLIEAIDGLGKGNVPAFTIYKKGVVWGESVKEFLRN